MAHKPNYKLKRLERQRAKAAKKSARLEAKMEKTEKRRAEDAGLDPADNGDAGFLGETPGEPTDQPRKDGDPNQ